MSYEEYQTPKKTFWPVMLLLAAFWVTLAFCAAAHADEGHSTLPPSGPDYVTEFGTKVYDPYHHSYKEEVEIWEFLTFIKAPPGDREAVLEVFENLTLVIHKGLSIEDEVYPCGKAPADKFLLGCTDPFDHVINIAWRPCGFTHSSAGVFAHETGHETDWRRRGVLGHNNPEWFGPTQDLMANKVEEPICRMRR